MITPKTTLTINRDGISDQVYEQLKEAILAGRFAQGERLNSKALAERFQVSISPIRDALQSLEADGLVNIIPRRGIFIVRVTRDMVRETFEIRQIIECASAEHMDTLLEEIVQQMDAIVREIEALQEDNSYRDYARYLALDTEFHLLIVQIINNKRLTEIYRQLRWSIQLALVFSPVVDRRATATLAEHKAIVAAFAARDREKAREAISNHLSKAAQDLLQHIADE